MIKAVLDSNVFISGILFPSSIPRKILENAESDKFRLVISKAIITEIRGVLRVKFDFEIGKLELFEELILAISELVEPKIKISIIKDDPDDNKILECAVEGKVNYIVSGDKHLLNVNSYQRIKIITPREFMDKFL